MEFALYGPFKRVLEGRGCYPLSPVTIDLRQAQVMVSRLQVLGWSTGLEEVMKVVGVRA